jgi:hypothetical protein
MVYYAYATDMLGKQQGGTTVGHAQGMLLAALYTGEFASLGELELDQQRLQGRCGIDRTVSITFTIVMKPAHPPIRDHERLKRYKAASNNCERAMFSKDHYRLELMVLVYWTYVQMES